MTRTPPLLPAAEAALVGVSFATILGFGRLFETATFVGPLLLFALLSHGIAIATRRLGWPIGWSSLVSAAGLVLAITWLRYPDTTTFALPTGSTIDAIRLDLSTAWTQFQDVVAPAPVEAGFIVAAAAALWVSAFVADWAAFRLWLPFEATVPTGTLFIFGSLLGAARHRAALTGVYIATLFIFMLLHRVTRQQTSATWLSSDIERGSYSLLRTGAGLATVALFGAVIVGPLLPGADASADVPLRRFGRGDSRVAANPLVSIKSQLEDQPDSELFRVRSNVRSYWRLTSLDDFDGTVWSGEGSFGRAGGNLPRAFESTAPEATITQTFEILDLASLWLPAAFEPHSFESDDFDAQWDDDSSTLVVAAPDKDAIDSTYEVVSVVHQPSAEGLAEAPGLVPRRIRNRFTDLPTDFPDRVADLARQITAGADTPYAEARALQDWFRGNFTYDIDADFTNNDQALEQFLFEVKRGFCQQFAGSFAAMARAIGLPARVAVGFTPGEEDAAEPGLYHVRGKYAHAWPEVWIAGFGWVPFEPTPGRGAPGSEAYTGVAEEQVAPDNPNQSVRPTSTTIADDGNSEPSAPTTAPTIDEPSGDAGAVGSLESPGWLERNDKWLVTAGLVALAAGLAYLAGMPLGRRLRRRLRRRRAADDPVARVRLAWRESAEAVSLLGFVQRPSETDTEFARRVAPTVAPTHYASLADTAQAATYSADGVSDEEATKAVDAAAAIEAATRHQTTRRQRIGAALDPRTLVGSGSGPGSGYGSAIRRGRRPPS